MWPFKKSVYNYHAGTFTFRHPQKLKLWLDEAESSLAFHPKKNHAGIMRVGSVWVRNPGSYEYEKGTVLANTKAQETELGNRRVLFDKTTRQLTPVDLPYYADALAGMPTNTPDEQIRFALAAQNAFRLSTYYWFYGQDDLFVRWSYTVFSRLEEGSAAKEERKLLTDFVFDSVRVKR